MSNRLFYAMKRLGVSPVNSTSFVTARGVQSVTVNTTFTIETVSELGNFDVYEQSEGIPNVEMSVEKALDGYAPVYILATQAKADGTAPSAATLLARSQTECTFGIAIYPEDLNGAIYADSGTPQSEVHMSSMFLSSVSYNVPVDGNATESTTFMGNNKVWVRGTNVGTGDYQGYTPYLGVWDTPWSSGATGPKAVGGSGGVQQRQDIKFGSGQSILPIDIPGITSVGGTGYNIQTANGDYGAHITGWSISVDLGRDEIFELGRKGSFYRFAQFPTEVTNEFTVHTTEGDLISFTEEGIYDDGTTPPTGCSGNDYNVTERPIKLAMCEGLVVDCGSQNILRSVNTSGGDTGGGNEQVVYTYSNNNFFTVQHPEDPVVALRP